MQWRSRVRSVVRSSSRTARGSAPATPSSISSGCASTSQLWRAGLSAVSWSGGCRRARPLHAAAGIIAVAPLAIVFAAWFLISEPKRRIDLPEMKKTFASLLAAFTLRDLWLIAGFLFLYYLSPGLGTPLYYHMTDDLKFSQEYIGILGSISSAGWIAGALLYRRFLKRITARALLNLSILFGTLTTAAFLLLLDEATAAVVNFCSGIAGMIAFVATLTLAADYCPQ